MKQIIRPAAIAAAMALSFGTAFAQGAGGSPSAGTGTSATGGQSAPMAQPGTGTRNSPTAQDDKIARADRKFIVQAAESGMFEVQAGQLASTQATNPQVKSFGSMLVDHHTTANNELTQLANSKKVELPAAPPRAMRRELEQLGKKQGQEFDRDFIRNVGIKAHEKDIKAFEEASQDAKDPQLKAWAAKTLPVLKQHLAQAQQLQKSMEQGGGDAARMGNTGGGASTGSGGASGANKTGS